MSDGAKKLDEIVPEWGHQEFVPSTDPFMAMAAARCAEMVREHPEVSVPTATVIVRDGKVLVLENGGQIHYSFCPRVALQSKSGTEYEYCPDHCYSPNHGEARASRKLIEKGIDGKGAVAYLAGHYWACMPCWEALRKAGVTELRIADDAQQKLKEKRHSPRAGMLSHSVKIAVIGDFGADMSIFLEGLRRVGFEIVDAKTGNPEVVALLPSGSWTGGIPAAIISDLQNVQSYKHAFTKLSADTEKLF